MKGYLLGELKRLKGMVSGRRISLFLDYDGTLTPIVARPENAQLSFQMKELLRKLSILYPVAIISGRSLSDIRALVRMDGLVYAGNHGMEVWAEDFTMIFDVGRGVRREIKRIEVIFRRLAERYSGVIVENKKLTLSLHYRLIDLREKDTFFKDANKVVAPSVEKGLVRITEGKRVLEIRPPVSWHKGRVVEWLLQRRRFLDTFPIYMGDDRTDLDGFRAVKKKGLSVYVGGVCREADMYLREQKEVTTFFKWLCHQP